jgi:hypothetical protein
MSGTLDSRLEDAFRAANADRERIKAFKDLAEQHPAAAAEAVHRGIPSLMERQRTYAMQAYGVDIAAPGWEEQFKQKPRTLTEASLLLGAANRYLVYSRCQETLDALAADASLSTDNRAANSCEVGLAALRGIEAAIEHYLQDLAEQTKEEAQAYVKNELAFRLTGQLATQISVRRNKRLAKALDALREGKKPAARERFEVLLKELYVLAPDIWSEHHVTDWQLRATRNAAVKEIENYRPRKVRRPSSPLLRSERRCLRRPVRSGSLPESTSFSVWSWTIRSDF